MKRSSSRNPEVMIAPFSSVISGTVAAHGISCLPDCLAPARGEDTCRHSFLQADQTLSCFPNEMAGVFP